MRFSTKCAIVYSEHRRTGDKNLGGLTPFRPKTILTRGVRGHAPPEKFQNFNI